MGLRDLFRRDTTNTAVELAEVQQSRDAEVHGLTHTVEMLESNITRLEQALLEPGWLRLEAGLEQEFTREGLRHIARLCRLLAIKNPLLRRASALKVYYVFGQGLSIAAKDELVNEVVTQFIEDPHNQAALFGQSAQEENEKALHTDANLFLTAFTHPLTGRVQVRSIPFDEVNDVIYSPDDAAEPWFYERRWTQVIRTAEGTRTELKRALYPDIDYRPRHRPAMWGGWEVRWDSPVLHVHTNRPKNWTFGVPEFYPALDWARAHTEFLDDFRRMVKTLSKFLWQVKTKGSQLGKAQSAMAKATAEDAPVGQTFVADHGAGELSTVKAGGIALSPQDARQLALMVSAATDIPETMLMGDPSTGNLATAETLDRPTELGFEHRRNLWATVVDRLSQHVIDASVLAPRGALSGVVERDEYGRLVITLRGDRSRVINVDWPPLNERSMDEVIKALAGSTGGAKDIPGMPDEVLLRLALVALDVNDPDEIVATARDALERSADERDEHEDGIVEAVRELRESIDRVLVAA
ncbi:hypothetical protein [Phytoactinopolyspora limicola]|uniref:hypothetical protein n=1 Tax=Phytoactinopolyspora limicola TaxID=2715536 RepID=UPI001409F6E1|nr:hypothetical protein [Phytoactinopolyspora limicola]